METLGEYSTGTITFYIKSTQNGLKLRRKQEMTMPDMGTIAILFLGILLGGIIFSSKFRIKFFKGLRHFLIGLSRGARNYTAQQQGRTIKQPPQSRPEVRHIYEQKHHLIKCETCNGTGRVEKKLPAMIDKKLLSELMEDCPECEGTGKVYD